MDSFSIERTVEEQIVNNLQERGIKLTWLSEKTNIKMGLLHNMLKGTINCKRKLSPESLEKINEALGTSFGNEQKK